jgi:hypothetical protein
VSAEVHPDWCACVPCEEKRAPVVEAPAAAVVDEQAPVSAEQTKRDRSHRNRKREVRAFTLPVARMRRSDLLAERAALPETARRALPLLRGDCENLPRPCPFVSCVHHLFLDVNANGNIKINFPDLLEADGEIRFEEMPATCSLDVADLGGSTLERVGEFLNITRERVRQYEEVLLPRLAGEARRAGLEAA